MPARSEHRRRLVFLHGFTQTHHHWHSCAFRIGRELGGDPTLAFVDLPGHGLSGTDDTTIHGDRLATLVGPGTLIGYSMGARYALHAAMSDASQIERLVLIGGTAGIDDPAGRAERQAADDALATRVQSIGVDAFLDEWLALPLLSGLPDDPAGLEHRRRNSADGLANSLRGAGTGAMESLWGALARIELPVLVIAGERDEKFTTIGHRLVGELPSATFVPMAGAGHAAHTERPDATSAAIAGWLRTAR